jgi:hypothetical protein
MENSVYYVACPYFSIYNAAKPPAPKTTQLKLVLLGVMIVVEKSCDGLDSRLSSLLAFK